MFNSECKYRYVIEKENGGFFSYEDRFNKHLSIDEATTFEDEKDAKDFCAEGDTIIYVEIMFRKCEKHPNQHRLYNNIH